MIPAGEFLEAFSAAVHDKELEGEGYEIYHFFDSDFLHRVIFGHRDALNHALIVHASGPGGDGHASHRLLMGALVGQRLGAPPLLRALSPHLYEIRLAVGRAHPREDYSNPETVIDLLGLRQLLRQLLLNMKTGDSDSVLQTFLEQGPEMFYGIELLSGRWQSRLGRLLELDIHKGSPFDYDPDLVASRAFEVIGQKIGHTYGAAGRGAAVNGLRDTMALSMLAQGIASANAAEPPFPLARFYTETPRIIDAWRHSQAFRDALTYSSRHPALDQFGHDVHGVWRTAYYYLVRALIPELGYTPAHEHVRPAAGLHGEGDPSVLFRMGHDLTEAADALRKGGFTDERLSTFPVGERTLGEYMAEVTEVSSYGGAWRRLMGAVPPGLPRGLIRDVERVIDGERQLSTQLRATFSEHLRALSARTQDVAAFSEEYANVVEALHRFRGAVRPLQGTYRQHFGLMRWGFGSDDVDEAGLVELVDMYEEWLAHRQNASSPGEGWDSRFPMEVTQGLHNIRGAASEGGEALSRAIGLLGFWWVLGDYVSTERHCTRFVEGILGAVRGLYDVEPRDRPRLERFGAAAENMLTAAKVRSTLGHGVMDGSSKSDDRGRRIADAVEVVEALAGNDVRFPGETPARAITRGYCYFYIWQAANAGAIARGSDADHGELADRSLETCRDALLASGSESEWYLLLANHCLYVALTSGSLVGGEGLTAKLARQIIKFSALDTAAWSYRVDDTLGFYYYSRAADAVSAMRSGNTNADELRAAALKDIVQARDWYERIPSEPGDNEIVAHRSLLRELEVEVDRVARAGAAAPQT